MARSNDRDDESSSPGDDDELAEGLPRPRRSTRRPPPRHTSPRAPLRKWRGTDRDDDEEDEEVDAPRARKGLFSRERHPVYWRARDSLYFEPLVALAIIVVLLVSLYAYTQNWPPVYVVESGSMQHGSSDVLGVINTGDLVLAQRIPLDQITPYVVGLQTGYSTYGEYGDVLLYSANGQGTTPIIHRAIVFLQWDPVTSSYNATDLSGLACGSESGAVYATVGTPNDCGVTHLSANVTLDLYHIGWRSVNVSVPLSPGLLGRHSGFLTMGDNNLAPAGCSDNCAGEPDQTSGLSQLVEPGWIVGVARGMIPWVGAVKLLIEGDAGMVPSQSWQFLGLTIVGLIALAFGVHYALRAEGIEDERRKEQEEEEAEEEAERPPSRTSRFLHSLRPWGRDEAEEDEEDEPRPRPRPVTKGTRGGRHRGRPAPRVRRATKPKRHDTPDDENDL
jgi:signal peptidase I